MSYFRDPTNDFIEFPQYFKARYSNKYPPSHMIEGSNTFLRVWIHFIYLLGHLLALMNAFLQKLFDILIQIFCNLQKFLQSWIVKIATFHVFFSAFLALSLYCTSVLNSIVQPCSNWCFLGSVLSTKPLIFLRSPVYLWHLVHVACKRAIIELI